MKEIRKRALEISIGLLVIWIILYYVFYPLLVGLGLTVFLELVSSPICLILADSKNRDGWSWYSLGFAFSLIALIVILFMKKKK